ncbi:MAG: GDSL-type esterase/lipase family protein [Eubacteriales bacterium]|nr:GDSL-type esterase/lipase family protein [Eubacteriales bacterium]
MDGYELRAECYRRLNKTAKKGAVVLAGSSLCEGFPVNELLMSRGESLPVYNRGISGDTIPGYHSRIGDCVIDLAPRKLFINIGTNDMNGGENGADEICANYSALLKEIMAKLPGCEIFVLSHYPINPEVHARSPWQSGRTNERIAQINGRVRAMAEQMGLKWLDVSTPLMDENGDLRAELTMDGVHMYPDAYEIVLDVLLPYMR